VVVKNRAKKFKKKEKRTNIISRPNVKEKKVRTRGWVKQIGKGIKVF